MIAVDPIAVDAAPVAAAKSYLRIAGSDEDAAIATLVAAAIAHGESFTRQQFLLRGVAETLPATCAWLRLGRTPVAAVSQVASVGADGVASALPVEAYAIDIDAAGDGWVRLTDAGAAPRCIVRYTAGLASGWDMLPDAIRQGTVRLASHLYAHRDSADEGAPPAAVAALWRPWRRMRLV